MMTFIRINRQREFIERKHSSRLTLRKDKNRKGIVSCYLSKKVRGDGIFVIIELDPDHKTIRVKTTNISTEKGLKMSRGTFSLCKVWEHMFYKNLHEDQIIIELEEKDDGWWYGTF